MKANVKSWQRDLFAMHLDIVSLMERAIELELWETADALSRLFRGTAAGEIAVLLTHDPKKDADPSPREVKRRRARRKK